VQRWKNAGEVYAPGPKMSRCGVVEARGSAGKKVVTEGGRGNCQAKKEQASPRRRERWHPEGGRARWVKNARGNE